MKVRLVVGMSNGKQPGDCHECSEDEARRMFASRFAVPWIDDEPERAVQVVPAIERRKRKPKEG